MFKRVCIPPGLPRPQPLDTVDLAPLQGKAALLHATPAVPVCNKGRLPCHPPPTGPPTCVSLLALLFYFLSCSFPWPYKTALSLLVDSLHLEI